MHSYERSVAVIGSGVAGLVAAYALSARDRVTLFEADTRIGGHAHTHYIDRGDGSIVGVDTAFLVHNDRTYPTLCRLFAELGIATKETDMSMSVRDDGSGLEYAGARGIGGLFPSWSSLTRPRYLLMLVEVKRFHAAATRLLQTDADGATLGAFLDRHGFSSYFVDHFMTPLVAAVWSCAARRGDALPGALPVRVPRAPRHALGVRLADVADRGRRLGQLRRGHPQPGRRGTRRRPGDVGATGRRRRSDNRGRPQGFSMPLSIATHPDQALLMLAEPTAAERAVLGSIPYCTNHAQLHTDESVLPRHWPGQGVMELSRHTERRQRARHL